MTRRLLEFTPLWAVGPKCDCISVVPALFEDGTFRQWGVQVCGVTQPAFVALSFLLIQVRDEISIGTDAREPIDSDALEEVRRHFLETPAIGAFHSGPLTGMFPHAKLDLAVACRRDTHGTRSDVWGKEMRNMVRNLTEKFNVPLLTFKTYAEMRERCRLG